MPRPAWMGRTWVGFLNMEQTPEAPVRSPRAEIARSWFWMSLAIAWAVNLGIQVLGMEFLEQGWWLVPRYVLSVVVLVAGLVWAWETYQRRRLQRDSDA